MEDIAFLTVEVRDQLFNLSRRHPFAKEAFLILDIHILFPALRGPRVIVVRLVGLYRVVQIYFYPNLKSSGLSAECPVMLGASPSQSTSHSNPPIGRGCLIT